MIRRTLIDGRGQEHWLLIDQIEHARLAGEIARVWGAEPFAPPWPRDELIAAVFHHDDGWAAWDARPGIDPSNGQPREFTEMPIAESLVIWTKSIAAGESIGPLAAWVVSNHFCALLRRTNAWQATSIPPSPEAGTFLSEQQALQANWLEAWQRSDRAQNTPAAAERALEYLQFFDALSLWLCCGKRKEESASAPGGTRFRAGLSVDPARSIQAMATISPWPLTVEELPLTVDARTAAVRKYASREELAAAPGERLTLEWRFCPGVIDGDPARK